MSLPLPCGGAPLRQAHPRALRSHAAPIPIRARGRRHTVRPGPLQELRGHIPGILLEGICGFLHAAGTIYAYNMFRQSIGYNGFGQ